MRYQRQLALLAVVLAPAVLCAVQLTPAAVAGSFGGWQVIGQIGGPTGAVAVQGDPSSASGQVHAYVGVGLRLVVLDVTDPATPIEVGATTPFPYFVEDVALSGTRAYVAAGGAGLRVVDISDLTHPTEIGAWDSPGYAEGVAVAGNTAYLADGPYGLRVIDVSDPAGPTPLGSAYDMDYAFDVAIPSDPSGLGGPKGPAKHAYIAAAGAGLLVADVTDPARPLEVGSLDTPGYAYGITVSGTVAYVADGWEGVRLVDISNPVSPTEVSAYKTPGWAFGLALSADRAYVADAFGGLRVLDVSSLVQPAELGGDGTLGEHAGSVAVAGDVAFVADRQRGLRVVDVTDPSHPTDVGLYDPMGYARGVAVAGGYAYVASGDDGFRLVDVTDPAHLVQVGSYDPHDHATTAVAGDDYVYLNCFGPGSLHVLDVAGPTNPTRIGWIDRGGRDMEVVGGIAYLANEWGLELVDVSDPLHLTLVGSIQLLEYVGAPDAAVGVAISGTLAYVASSFAGIEIVDVSDPLSPTLVARYDSGSSFSQDLAIARATAYVADYSGLRILDVSDPLNPSGMGFYDTPGEAYGVVVSGTIAYVADGAGGVSVLDVSDGHSPTLVGHFNTLGYAHQVAVAGVRIYVADALNGLLILEQGGVAHGNRGTASGQPAQPEQIPVPHSNLPAPPARYELAPLPRAGSFALPPVPAVPPGATGHEEHGGAATCQVSTAADSGPGTLRACLENAVSGDTITFDPGVFPPAEPVTITLTAPLPWLDQGNVRLDASNAGVILDGSHTLPGTTGLVVTSDANVVQGLQVLHFPGDGIAIADGASYNRIGGDRLRGSGPLGQGNLLSGNTYSGVSISGSGTMSNTVSGNLIGTDRSGTQMIGNEWCVSIGDGANHNWVGGATEGERNIIGGAAGINIHGAGTAHNVVQNNLVGTDISGAAGLRPLPPDGGCCTQGIAIAGGAHHNTIGPGNVVNSYFWGLLLSGNGTDENLVVGNLIGTDLSGTAAIGNYSSGVLLDGGARRNRIGGATPGEGNLVSGNGGNGIDLSSAETMSNTLMGNYIGTDASGTAPLGNQGPGGGIQIWSPRNRVEQNLVSANGSNGISLIGSSAWGNVIAGNYAGVDVSGTVDLGNRGHGIAIEGPGFDNLFEENLSSGNARAGILVSGASHTAVVGNQVGTDASGTMALPNDWCGVVVEAGSFNRIGGTEPGDANLVSGNASGICAYGPGGLDNLIRGNLIGTDLTGARPLGNQWSGVSLGADSRSILGGAAAGEGNVISGNGWPDGWPGGIEVSGDYHLVVGNRIGTDVSGATPLGNRYGLWLRTAEHAIIQGNLIAHNAEDGVLVESYAGNTLRRNAIHGNARQGIALIEGGNHMLPAPVILTVTETSISGTACPRCTVETFSDAEDEGRIYEGTAIADAVGHFTFEKCSPLTGPYLTATATDGQGNTSEFSAPAARPVKVYLPMVLKGH